jgi:SpoIID/LytB domain protein
VELRVSYQLQRPTGRFVRALMAIGVALAAFGFTSPPASADTQLTVTGHGYGHGRGMGQWGAFGYATQFGWNYHQITDHYYGGTTLGVNADNLIAVRLLSLDGVAPIITSGASFTVGGVLVPAGGSAQVQLQPNGSWLLVTSNNGCTFNPIASTPITDATENLVADPGDNLNAMLAICEADGKHQYRGFLREVNDAGTERTTSIVDMEQYTRDVVPRESPASWGSAPNGMEALKAQAVAARSYAWAENRWFYARTCDNTFCQSYGGAGINGTSLEDPRSDAATAATATQVRLLGGAVARTEFSSSSGGYTAGGTFPPVPDDGDVVSPYHNWSVALSGSAIAAAYGVGTFQSAQVTSRNGFGDGGGRVLSMLITGTGGSVTTTGDDFRSRMGLRSNWFFLPPPSGPQWFLRNSLTSGNADLNFAYGLPGDVTLSCKWAGKADTPAVFRNGTWYIRLSNTTGVADITFNFGIPGDTPICGDWTGTGSETPGVVRNGVFYLRNSLTTGGGDVVVHYGNPGDIPLAGRWTGGLTSTVGIYRPGNSTFYLRNTNTSGVADEAVPFGIAGDRPVVGDWNGDGTETIGVYRSPSATFYLVNSNVFGSTPIVVLYGSPGDNPLPGDWIGQGHDTIGIIR